MSGSPLVSIIIPTYNRAHILEEALRSVEEQTYAHWECIIIDDGSTDATEEVLQPFLKKDPRFYYQKRPSNLKKGPSACRNYGYEKSRGEYIQWFDSDDLMHPDKIKLKVETALKYRGQVIVDNHSETKEWEEIEDFKVDSFTSSVFYIDFLLGKRPVITNDVMLKRSIIGLERFDENLMKGEEYELFSRIFNQELTYCFMEVALTFYSVSDDSLSVSPKQVESLIYLSKLIARRHGGNQLLVARAERLARKVYRGQAKRRNILVILKDYNFFRKAHHKSFVEFAMYVVYNVITGRGFDAIKPKIG